MVNRKTEEIAAEKQRDEVLSFILREFRAGFFSYDVAEDTMFYIRTTPECQYADQKITDFQPWILGQRFEGQTELLKIIQLAMTQEMCGETEIYMVLDGETGHWVRIHYKSMFEDGQAVRLVGYTVLLDEEHKRSQGLEPGQRDVLTKLYNCETTELMVNQHLVGLHAGEKGVFFLMAIDKLQQVNKQLGASAGDGYLRAVAETLRSDFRDVDIFGRVSENEFGIFLRGCVSIDIIEKKAQHIIDLFMQVQLQNFNNISCGIGIAATGSPQEHYEALLSRARIALKDALARGGNRFRMYDGEKY